MCCKSIKDLAGIRALRDVKRGSSGGGGWWLNSHFGNGAECRQQDGAGMAVRLGGRALHLDLKSSW
jgi:hypothetical protein